MLFQQICKREILESTVLVTGMRNGGGDPSDIERNEQAVLISWRFILDSLAVSGSRSAVCLSIPPILYHSFRELNPLKHMYHQENWQHEFGIYTQPNKEGAARIFYRTRINKRCFETKPDCGSTTCVAQSPEITNWINSSRAVRWARCVIPCAKDSSANT